MTGKKFLPYKPWKPRDGRTSFGGRTNPAVIDFEKRERTFQVFAYFAQNRLDEDADEKRE